jgi:hypothetical protein
MAINSYIDGKRSGQEINALERLALQDKFLEEALEGYDKIKVGQAQNIADLQAQILNKKACKKIPAKLLATALGILILVVLAAIFICNLNNIFPKKTFVETKNILQNTDTTAIVDTVKIIKIDTIVSEKIIKKPFIKKNIQSVEMQDIEKIPVEQPKLKTLKIEPLDIKKETINIKPFSKDTL